MQRDTVLRFVRAFAIGFGLVCAFWLALNLVPTVPSVPTVHAQQVPAPCSQSQSLTTTGTGPVVNTTGSGSTAGCVGFRITWYVTGFTGLTIALQGSQDNSSWANIGSTYVQEGTNPTTWTASTGSNTIVVRAYFPYVRVNVSSVTGSGRVTWLLYGYPGTSAQMDLGGGGSGGSCASLGGDLTGTCAAAVVVQAQSGVITFTSGGNINANGQLASGVGSGFTGDLELNGKTSGTQGFTVSDAAGTANLYVLPTATASGSFLKDNGTVACPSLASGAPGACEQLAWAIPGGAGTAGYSGSSSITSGNTYYLPPVGGTAANATESNVQGVANTTSTLSNLAVRVTAAPGVGNSLVFTFRDGGTGTAVTCTISGGSATTCTDTTHSVNVTAGDLIDWQVVDTGVTATDGIVITYSYGSVVGVGPGAYAYQSTTSQVIGSGSSTAVTFDTNVYDTGSIHSTVSNTSRFTAPSTGYYLAQCQLTWNANVSAGSFITIEVNGSLPTTYFQGQLPVTGATSAGPLSAAGILHLNAADYIECYAIQFSGSNKTVASLGSSAQLTKLSSSF